MTPSADAPESPSALRVLIVEDSQDDATLVVAELRRGGFRVTWERVETGAALEGQLTAGTWDLVVSDNSLPQFSGTDALTLVRARAGDLPFIIVSGTIGEAQAVAAMKAGATDYLLKGQLARLASAVERALAEVAARRRREATEQTLRWTEDQLRHAQKMEAIGRLAGGIAHDFNNLLTAILGYSELVLSEMPPDARRRADIDEIRHAGQRAASLTRQLLAFSRQQVLELRLVHLNDLVVNVETLLQRVIGEDVELGVDLDPTLQPVRVDPGQIEQVLMNLAINARDAMPSGGHLSLQTSSRLLAQPLQLQDVVLPAGPYAFVGVTDTGTGMPPDIVARIFDPFFTTKEPGKGTGLGLSTAYGIVRQTGGAIVVDSQPGRGTTFGLYLPCADGPAEALLEGGPATQTPAPVGGSETVLIVDDEPGIRALVCRALEPLGYRVLQAANGVEALSVLGQQAGAIHLLITDVVMPVMGGRDLVTRVSEVHGRMPVLLLSGYPDSSQVEFAIPNHVQAFMMKPFTPAVLARKVRDLLNQASGHSQDSRASS
jgi:signal transduction histidine kinase